MEDIWFCGLRSLFARALGDLTSICGFRYGWSEAAETLASGLVILDCIAIAKRGERDGATRRNLTI